MSKRAEPTKEHGAAIVRNREILHEMQTEFRKIQAGSRVAPSIFVLLYLFDLVSCLAVQANLLRKRESAQLFRKLHTGATETASGHSLEPLLRERSALQAAHKSIDGVIG